jgi:Na+/melibiose symporter-like transporter
MIIIPILSKRFDKKLLIIVSVLLQVIAFLAFYLVGYQNLTNILIVVGFIGFFMGLIDILIPSMFSETIDYSEWKLGTRAEGMVWSTQTLAVKAGTAFGGIVLGIILTSVGYVQNAVQTARALNGIHITISLVVGGIFLISLIPIFFYSLTRSKYKIIMEELEEKRLKDKK